MPIQKIFILIFILIFSSFPAYAEDNSFSFTESILSESAPSKPTGGINFEAVEDFEGEAGVSFYADATAAAETTGLTAGEYIIQECMKHSALIYLEKYSIDKNEIDDIFYDIATKNPELMVHTGFRYSADENSIVTRIAPYYINATLAEDIEARALMEEKINEYIEYASSCPDKIGKLLLIHDKMIEDCMYDYTPYVYSKVYNENTGYYQYVAVHDYNAHHAYGVFANKEAVCQGFAQAIYAICKKLDINADFVISDELNHMWNQIEADGEWYHLDLTWNEVHNTNLGYHRYFLLSDSTMSTDHGLKSTWSTYSSELKDCTSTRFESNHIFNFPELSHISYADGKYTLPFTLGQYTAIFESDTLYTGPMITSAPIELTDTTGIFFTAVTDSISDISAVGVFSQNGKTLNISAPTKSFNKNTLLEFSYKKGSADRTLSCMFMDLDTLIPYSKKITID